MGNLVGVESKDNSRLTFTRKFTINTDQIQWTLWHNGDSAGSCQIRINEDTVDGKKVYVQFYDSAGAETTSQYFDYTPALDTTITYELDLCGSSVSLRESGSSSDILSVELDRSINTVAWVVLGSGTEASYEGQTVLACTSSSEPASNSNLVWIILFVLALVVAGVGIGTTIYFWQKSK